MPFDPNTPELDDEDVEDRVAAAIEENEVVLFMKGDELMPQCGYSKRALGLIQQYRSAFETVDVLQNIDAFRESLEARSGWETTPQTFVDGEFIGGSDILAELDERGELVESLNVDPAEVETEAAGGDADGDAADDDGIDAPF